MALNPNFILHFMVFIYRTWGLWRRFSSETNKFLLLKIHLIIKPYNKPLARFETIFYLAGMKSTEISPRVPDGRLHAELVSNDHRWDSPLFVSETILYLKAFGWYEVLVTLVHDSLGSWFSILGRYKNGYVNFKHWRSLRAKLVCQTYLI